MTNYGLSHLSNGTLLRDLQALVTRDRAITAALLAHLAEADARKLYLPAGCASMFAYCVQELRLSEDAAYKRIQAARAARQFPALFIAVAEGRLNLTGVGLLAPHLTVENADELLGSSAGKSKSEIEEMLARRFPRSEVLPMVETLPSLTPGPDRQLAPAQVGLDSSGSIGTCSGLPAPRPAEVRSKVAPVAPERYALQITIGRNTHDMLRYAQDLLSHQIPKGDLADVLHCVLEMAIGQLERRKFAATTKPRLPHGASTRSARHIPSQVKRAVWHRDQGRCTFVSESGHHCPSRKFLEFDHVNPVARGGKATTENLRLRCRAHNQYAADNAFGTAFMSGKRQEARRATIEARKAAKVRSDERAEEQAMKHVQDQAKQQAKQKAAEVIPWLRALGFRADEARWRAERCEAMPDAPLEDRVRMALSYVSPRIAFRGGVDELGPALSK